MTRESKQERAEAALAPTTPQLDGFFVGEMASQREGGNDFKHIKRRASDPILSLSNSRNLQRAGMQCIICGKCAASVAECMVLREENAQLKFQSGQDQSKVKFLLDADTKLESQGEEDQTEMKCLQDTTPLKYQGNQDQSEMMSLKEENKKLKHQSSEDHAEIQALQDNITKLRSQGDEDQSKIKGLHDEITGLLTKGDKDQAEMRGLRDEITGHELQAEFVGLALCEENTSLKCKSGELQAELQAAQMAEAAAKDEARDTKNKMQRLRERHALQTKTLQPRMN